MNLMIASLDIANKQRSLFHLNKYNAQANIQQGGTNTFDEKKHSLQYYVHKTLK